MADFFESASGLNRGFINGHQRARDYLEALLDRIARLDPQLQSFVAVHADTAQVAADAADAALRRGYPIGPMTGVPFALKDIVDVAGQPGAGGCKALQSRIAQRSAVIAERLLGAGGVLLGKTHTVELAMGGWGTNRQFGTPKNPWDLHVHRTPGGSSSGSGVAVAAGLVPFAIGTDTGGSVRLPAAWNGIVGLKVTEGTVPTQGIIPLSHTLDTPGPMARSVQDCAMGFEILRGVEPHRVLEDMLQSRGLFSHLSRGVKGLMIAAMPDSEREGVEAEILDAYDASLDGLAARGALVRSVSLPQAFEGYRDRTGIIIAAEAYYHHKDIYENPASNVDEDVRPRILSGRDLTAQMYLGAVHGRIADRCSFLTALDDFDVLVTPTVATAALPIDVVDQTSTPARFTRAANYLGLCAASVPNAVTHHGLPSALQIIARPNAEALVLRIAADIEAAAGGRFPSPNLSALS